MSIRVLVVDDSATMRGLITATLRADPQIDVVGQAADPEEARAAIKTLTPDVITLDIEMPKMDGLAFLEKIMRLRPMPVVMVSTMTQAGAKANLRALEIGAFDCVGKPSALNRNGFDMLAEKVKEAARSRRLPGSPPQTRGFDGASFTSNGKIVAIGASTGGVEALLTILQKFPANCPPTLISQHMPPSFTHSFAARLNKSCAAEVSEAVDGAKLMQGQIYLAPGDAHLELSGMSQPYIRLNSGERVNGHRPSADVMFNALRRRAGAHSVGVILTGLGRDGAEGLLALRQAGAETIGQDEASCVVYGMPKAAFELGAVARQLPLERIAEGILAATDAERVRRR